jgi:hypothetical protein
MLKIATPFRTIREMYPFTLHALMEVYLMLGVVVVNLNYSTCVETFANLGFNICIKETLGSYFKCYVGNIVQTC